MSHELRKHDMQFGRSQAWHGLTKVNPLLSLSDEDFYLRTWDIIEEQVGILTPGSELVLVENTDRKPKKVGQKAPARFIVSPEVETVLEKLGIQATDLNGIEFTTIEKLLKPLAAQPVITGDFKGLIVKNSQYLPEMDNEDEQTRDGAGTQATMSEDLWVSAPYNPGTYTPMSNKAFLDLIEKSLSAAGLPLDVESVGSVFNKRRTFLTIKLPEMPDFEAGGRQFNAFLNFLNSFDETTPFFVNSSNTCTVCNNTFVANLQSGGCVVKHTKNMAQILTKLPDTIAAAVLTQKEFQNDFLTLFGMQVGLVDAENLFMAFLSDGGALSTRSYNIGQRLMSLFNKGAGNNGENGADMFSAITDYYTHESAGKNKEKQFQSSEFGSGATLKRDGMKFLLSLVEDVDARKEAIDKGHKAILEYNQRGAAVEVV